MWLEWREWCRIRTWDWSWEKWDCSSDRSFEACTELPKRTRKAPTTSCQTFQIEILSHIDFLLWSISSTSSLCHFINCKWRHDSYKTKFISFRMICNVSEYIKGRVNDDIDFVDSRRSIFLDQRDSFESVMLMTVFSSLSFFIISISCCSFVFESARLALTHFSLFWFKPSDMLTFVWLKLWFI